MVNLLTSSRLSRELVGSFSPFVAGVSAVAIALGSRHTCAIVSGGGVKCWGLNDNGQLGTGSRTDATSPADVAGDWCPPVQS
jgi:alpha-tubulin suppressor-like RCC1 family protein